MKMYFVDAKFGWKKLIAKTKNSFYEKEKG